MIEALEKIIPQLPPDVKIIPGHGPISNLDDMRKYVKMLRETTATVQTALKQGKSLEQMKQERLLDNWKQWSGSFVSTDTYLETVYNDLTGKKNDKFVQHN
jgi:glyoxylase-like metal-dependent hydrolase (beta-lactamase superfamily II)